MLTGLDKEQLAVVRQITRNRVYPYLRAHIEALIDDLGSDLIAQTRIDTIEWLEHLLWARNDIAHRGAPNHQAGAKYVTGSESRAVRDAIWVMLALGLAKHLGVPHRALLRAAERLGVQYGVHRYSSTIFT